MPMAGYKPRDHFDSVHDSLYARLLLLKMGERSAAILSVDLLIFPPVLRDAIEKKLIKNNADVFLFPSATHTHNGLGGWDDSLLGKAVSGTFRKEWIDVTAEKIVKAIIQSELKESSLNYWESDAKELVVNRLAPDGKKDGTLRGLQITRVDSSRAILFTFSAHPTSITSKSLALSADYPGRTIELLEQDFDFGMFLSGMVGSHRFAKIDPDTPDSYRGREANFDLVEAEAELVNKKIKSRNTFSRLDSVSISMAHIPISFGPSQLRVSKNWKARNWILNAFSGGLKGELTYLRLGDIIMIGTPSDFSGEIFVRDSLESFARQYNKHLIITSFNGNYVGYITYDGHYDSVLKSETLEMNWVGPYHGEYFSSMIRRIIEKDAATF